MENENRAAAMAKKHLSRMNPSLWDGMGEQPKDFNPIIATYPIDGLCELDISFEQEDSGEWCHLCELRDKGSEELLAALHGYGIDSPQNLADTIADVCQGML